MYLILTSSKDAYITDKIIESKFRATDANTGRAGTIDLFKLYNESFLSGETNPIELSRALIKFDLNPLKTLTGSNLDIDNFKCFLSLKSIDTGHFTPSNFTLTIYPVSQSWDEGIGRDVGSFSDIDVVNFNTASFGGGTLYPWFASGANKMGLLGSDDIDIVSSGNLGFGVEDLFVEQHFHEGKEDLYVDITKMVSATLVGLLPDHGFRVSFSQAEEEDEKSRFVKRFYSRHVNNVFRQPSLRVLFDDSIKDDHETFYFNTTGSLFISNVIRGTNQNILSGTGLTEISGENCLLLKLTTGSVFEKIISASSYTMSTTGDPIRGLYSANFCIPYTDESLVISGTQNFSVYDIALASGSIKFNTEWCSIDQNVIFATGTLAIKAPKISRFNAINQNPSVKIVNLKSKYSAKDKIRFRLFGRNLDNKIHPPVKLPLYAKSEYFDDVHYSVKDFLTGEVVIPFDREFNSTRVSRDGEGMFFDFKMSTLFIGKNYVFEFLIIADDREYVDTMVQASFRIEK
jgi:hypothetical protein